ncbi:chemotaxis response regulator protein-glutamate methylesterase [Shewanella sp. NIFS-20-20]|uniref:protein-glutamate methylesterase/protein-glutamine glutaminase n=1 Tax=Shewanella sp. NIFS-20-20 TaxID=2853806 RepID=UPI001C47AB67|nr:chemotaxis response regulator protein-glutamate methylesterase [Shewanella sp. NIFS-20-20]MBV7316945.1 chemotaxis response regulator protein-glutamate methylesterase [Shewanella sp. NIFS-20-20]
MIKVLVIDDSALVRQLLTHMLEQANDITVVGCAENPLQAREMIKTLSPDVLTLDIEMPKMDGIAFLRNLMRLRPMPVVMISTLTEKGAAITLEALSLGAIDFIAKPKNDLQNSLPTYQAELLDKVRQAARCRVRSTPPPSTTAVPHDLKLKNRIIAIGASTGGTEAIAQLISALPANFPPVVIAQHIPAAFSASFARRLDAKCNLNVSEARGNEVLKAGYVYVAPGDKHMTIVKKGMQFYTQLVDTAPVNRHKPSVEVLFNSIAECAAQQSIGVMLTGMGKDGAQGLLAMKEHGSYNLCQDEATSVVWGMPGAAVAIDAHHEQQPLHLIANRLLSLLKS